jgi:hypothetical protein
MRINIYLLRPESGGRRLVVVGPAQPGTWVDRNLVCYLAEVK